MPRRDPAKEKYWRRVLRRWRRSGLTPRAFCVEQRVSEPGFYAWRREIERRDQQAGTTKVVAPLPRARSVKVTSSMASTGVALPAFVKLAMAADVALPPAIEVVVAERRLLRVRPGFDAELLRQLLRLLEEPSC